MIHLSKDVLIKDAPDRGSWTSKKFIKKNPQYDLEAKLNRVYILVIQVSLQKKDIYNTKKEYLKRN